MTLSTNQANSDERADDALVRAYRGGDVDAFDALIRAHAPGVISTAERIVGDRDAALDVAQDVFVELHRMLPRYREQGKFRAMLYSIVHHRALDACRRRSRSRLVFLGDSRDGAAVPDPIVPDATPVIAERAVIDEALGRVDDVFREAVQLRDVVGCSYEEIADALGIEVGTAKSRVNRGRLQFRDHYERLSAPPRSNGGEEGHHVG